MRIREAQKHTHPADHNTGCTARLRELAVLFSIVVLYLRAYKSAFSRWLPWNKQCCGSGVFDPGSGMENPDPASWMNISDNFSESLETVFKVKNTCEAVFSMVGFALLQRKLRS
jgi:hypothetical protein